MEVAVEKQLIAIDGDLRRLSTNMFAFQECLYPVGKHRSYNRDYASGKLDGVTTMPEIEKTDALRTLKKWEAGDISAKKSL